MLKGYTIKVTGKPDYSPYPITQYFKTGTPESIINRVMFDLLGHFDFTIQHI